MSGRPVRIGLQLQPEHADYATIRRTAAEAEALGADAIFIWDHFFPLTGEPEGKHFECWTVLAALAESTSTVQLGPLVSCVGYRNPDLLADMARTVDHISGGRAMLGLGSGWCEKDFTGYGYPFGSDGERLRELAAAIPRVKSRLSNLNPAPAGRLPLLLGGGGEKRTLRLVAEHADIWHAFHDPATIRHKLSVLHKHCADVGRDPAEIEVSTSVSGLAAHEGDPREMGPELRELGVSLFIVGAGGPDFDLGTLRRWIDWRDGTNA
ncbi:MULTISPECIES: LLM class F420-dependent oxidoreductase [Streptomyces]|uniref:LLM class F420-dependent oxidoreductase n=1 Tax=Streptomyces spororaveus TaxID=284039 RepID=A0ABQ3TGS5_9ACTN|nr:MULTISPECIES: LLM class F420-dependent oxidoreductase [Streptomyces]MCM9080040.1 LLM class F420-dependent oxidoreductase [Streptomyces spororaveus]MCX5305546.1 LLM class F420-dependent oxidoreductase [Streptomyces sp. NBC_00160]GHI79614.1 LLM class F420-dependent oxidoreductase [Streptomyces spororaveus]